MPATDKLRGESECNAQRKTLRDEAKGFYGSTHEHENIALEENPIFKKFTKTKVQWKR